MDRLRLPNWAPYLAFVAVVAVLIAFSVATRGDSKEASGSSAPVNQPVDAERLSSASGPRGVVLQLWQLVQQGNYPLAALLYHPRVVEVFGAERLMGALALQRQTVLQNRPAIASIKRTRLGTLVTVQTEDSDRPLLFSFNVVKRRGKWTILFDSLLGDALPQYVQKLSPKATGAGEKAASRYRGLFLPKGVRKHPGRGRTTAPSRSSGEPAAPPESPAVTPNSSQQSPTPPAVTTPSGTPPTTTTPR